MEKKKKIPHKEYTRIYARGRYMERKRIVNILERTIKKIRT